MVTRYTIDQILSCNNNNNDPNPALSVSPSRSLNTPPSDSPVTPVTPSSPKSFTILKDALDISISTRSTEEELPENLSRTKPFCEQRLEGERNSGNTMLVHGHGTDKPPPITYDPARHIVARPVPVRPAVSRSNGPSLEKAPLSTPVGAPSADGLCSGLGYSLTNGLSAENNFYTLMFRHYVEAQLRELANSRPYAPLAYPMLDPALPHLVGGANLPYPLSSRSRRRGGQVRFTGDQTRQLESWFHLHKYINPSQRKTIARELSLQERQVKTWFQNRRAKWRKLEAQPGADGCPTEMAPSPVSSNEGSGGEDSKDEADDNAPEDDLDLQEEEEEKSFSDDHLPCQKNKRLRGAKPPEKDL